MNWAGIYLALVLSVASVALLVASRLTNRYRLGHYIFLIGTALIPAAVVVVFWPA